jgi:hypothetical protein
MSNDTHSKVSWYVKYKQWSYTINIRSRLRNHPFNVCYIPARVTAPATTSRLEANASILFKPEGVKMGVGGHKGEKFVC